MPKPRSPRRDTEAESGFASRCPDCASPDPQLRAYHQLDLSRVSDLDTLRAHLSEQYVKLREEGKQRPDVVDDICQWVANLMQQYSGMADPDTGALMPWWKARQYMSDHQEAIARSAYARAPEGYKTQAGNLGPLVRRVMSREPGDDDPGSI